MYSSLSSFVFFSITLLEINKYSVVCAKLPARMRTTHHYPSYLFPRIIFICVLECGKIQSLRIVGETIRKSNCKNDRE